jgi:putative ABC transport system ATP-binding protein
MALIELRDVTKVYDAGDVQVRALAGVSLDVEAGESIAIMGASGSGKSTLMNVLGCLDRPTSGTYRLAGEDVGRLDRNRLAEIRSRTLGFVFQSFNLLARTSAVENVELPLLYSGVASAERRRRAEAALGRVGLAERAHHHPSQLSGGQQQRVAIARALVVEPRIILADEPTGNLDSRTSVDVMSLLQALGDSGITIVLVTHEPDIARYAGRVLEMKDGLLRSDVRRPAVRAVPSPASAPEDEPAAAPAEDSPSLASAPEGSP